MNRGVQPIPAISVAALFAGPAGAARDRCDADLCRAASTVGFLTVTDLPPGISPTRTMRADLKRIFAVDADVQRRLWRRKFASDHSNVYRGWFPVQDGAATYKEGIDLGPDVAHPDFCTDAADPLTEPTPLPTESELPGWRAAIARHYLAMESLADTLIRALARGLGIAEHSFDAVFAHGGLSTLRLVRYPVRPPGSLDGAPDVAWIEHRGRRCHTIGAAHVDTGCMTLLVQDGVEGLQARHSGGAWLDIPPQEDAIVVNFGVLLERWTGGRIRATEHRVVGSDRERFSIPYFYEPRVDAVIAPLAQLSGAGFEPFLFGDYLWAAVTRFVEFRGLESVRPPRGVPPPGSARTSNSPI